MGKISGNSSARGCGRQKRVRPKLIVLKGDQQKIVELTGKVTSMGRSHDNTIEIDDINSSRNHCHRSSGSRTRTRSST